MMPRRALALVFAAALASPMFLPGTPTNAVEPPPAFVQATGTGLTRGGEPYRFAGVNIYNANSDGWCGHEMRSPGRLGALLDALDPGSNAFRAWFVQPLSQNAAGTDRDWSAFDNTLAEARAHGLQVIVTLSNHWGECGNRVATGTKSPDWYRFGYTAVDAGQLTSYRDYVAEVVARYRDDPTVLMWQLMNEAETKNLATGDCEVGGEFVLRDFAADVSGMIKSLDPNHLVSLGTLGGPQCGPNRDFYGVVHDVSTIDVCEFHDYSPTEAMPTFIYGDGYDNGLATRIDICHGLGKPIFVGESGVPRSMGLDQRAKRIRAKVQAQFRAGVVGYLAWDFADSPLDTIYDLLPGDLALAELRVQTGPAFVAASGTQLTVDGAHWQLHGASTYHTTNRGGPNDPDQIIAMAQAAGLNTLRIGEMFDQYAGAPPGAPYDATDWARTDAFLDKLREAGLRAILDLSAFRNFLVHRDVAAGGWTDLCRDDGSVTVEQRMTVDFAGTSPYRPAVLPEWDTFLDFVAHRVNTVNGLAYRDDPTIAIVSFAGEPNPPDSLLCGKAANTAELTAFYAHVLSQWKSHDSTHLLSNGGFIHLDWAELHGDLDGSGIDWEAIFALPANDVPSIHTYPARIDGRVPADYQSPKVSAFVAGLGKPWFTEEFGWPQGVGTGDATRADYYEWVYEQQVTYGSAGAAFWNLGVESAGGTFDVSEVTPLTWTVVQANAPDPIGSLDLAAARLEPGESVGTDDDADPGATSSDAVETSVFTPNAGLVLIRESPVDEPDTADWYVLDHSVKVHAPAAGAGDPLRITFVIDASLAPPEVPTEVFDVFRDGGLVADCADVSAGTFPCVAGRSRTVAGDLEIEVRTTGASEWTFAVDLHAQFVTISAPADGSVFERGQAVVVDYVCAALIGSLSCQTTPAITGYGLLDTWFAGPHTFTLTAEDHSGNVTEVTHHYEVLPGDPRLTGAEFQALDIFSFENGVVTVDVDCHEDGLSTVSYQATGETGRSWRPGPFPGGTFTETGTFTMTPEYALPGEGVAYGDLQSFSASFTIESPAGRVVGTKSLLIPGYHGGICDTPSAGSPFSGANLRLIDALSYDAAIVTAEGASRDSGTAADFLYFACAVRCDDGFESRFITDGTATEIDADGDGVDDRIGSGGGAFDDGAGTTGSIVDAAGNAVLVLRDPDGVRITANGGTANATLLVCGFALQVAPGSELVTSCGSITVKVIAGAAKVSLGGGLVVVTILAGTTALVGQNADGSYLVENISGDAVSVTVDGVTTTVAPGGTLHLEAWDFIGFSSPVDNPPIVNVVKAGTGVPLKWRLLDVHGSPVTGLASASLRVTGYTCASSSSTDLLEEVAAGASGLQNLGNGYYQFNWKTPKTYAKTCKVLALDIGDGVAHTARFSFTK